MKIKVCGLKDSQNVKDIASLAPDYMGFIFYPPSPRHALGLSYLTVTKLPKGIKKVGVFVNATREEILEYADIHHLDAVQLHGDESPELCRRLQNQGLEVIKAFRIPENTDESFFNRMVPYLDFVDLFLFDTAGKEAGGNGEKFNWNILNSYPFETPYLLSGGIGEEDIEILKEGLPSKCIGIDINSKFEISPGIKDVKKVADFINRLREDTSKNC